MDSGVVTKQLDDCVEDALVCGNTVDLNRLVRRRDFQLGWYALEQGNERRSNPHHCGEVLLSGRRQANGARANQMLQADIYC